jgi:GNAT superfamily N-acetyltransferase
LSEDVAAALTVRAATLADARAIAAVHRDSWRSTYAGILPLAVIAREAGRRSEASWRKRLAVKHADSATWMAERGAHGVVGFASCGPARAPLEGLGAEVYALYVLQAHQRRGVGRELMRACARHFARHGIFGMYLWVLKANRARFFYETLGGQEIATKTERLGQHEYAEIAYGWHDLAPLVLGPPA